MLLSREPNDDLIGVQPRFELPRAAEKRAAEKCGGERLGGDPAASGAVGGVHAARRSYDRRSIFGRAPRVATSDAIAVDEKSSRWPTGVVWLMVRRHVWYVTLLCPSA